MCDDACNQYSDSQIATNQGITESQVVSLKALCPAECPIPPGNAGVICTMKSNGMTLETVINSWSALYTVTQITEAYNSCA